MISRADSNGAFTVAPSTISLTYTANGLNQYSTITGGTQTLSAGPQATLTYDPLGRIQSETSSGNTSNFLYDGAFLAEEYTASGTTTARYVPGPGADEPLAVYSGADLSSPGWYAADQEGSIIATANAGGAETASYAYGPYGEPLTSGGATAWGGARYRYTGQIEIPGALAYFYKARMYDPGTGRFFQTDPAGFGGGINIYSYAMNDPVNGWDPMGLDDCAQVPLAPAQDGTVSEVIVCGSTLVPAGGGAAGGSTAGPGGDPKEPTKVAEVIVIAKRPQNNQPSPSNIGAAACAALVAKNDLAGSALDAASIIPGGGDLADFARLSAGAASLGISVSQGNKIGTAIGATGTALGGVVVARNTINAAAVGVKDGLEAVPGIGIFVGLGALVFDAYSAVDDYNKCISGR